jgi:hypothetical protein
MEAENETRQVDFRHFDALAKQDFEVRLIEDGAVVIFDLLYEKGGQIRPTPPQLARLVFNNVERIGEWLEEQEREAHGAGDERAQR